MKLLEDLSIGISSYFKAFKFIFNNKLGVYFIIPVVLNILLFLFGLELIEGLSDWFRDLIINNLREWFEDVKGADFYKKFVEIFLWVVLRIVYLLIFAFFGGYIVMVLMSPLFAYLSEKTEAMITKQRYKFNATRFIKDIVRGIYIASRNLIFELLFTLIFTIIGFIPLVNLISPFALFLVSSYYYGFSFMDYCNERRKPTLKEGVQFIRKNKAVAIGNGAIFMLLLIIPFIGVILASMMSIVAVVAGTMAYIKIDVNHHHASQN